MAYMQGLQGSACSDYQSFNLPFSELLKPPNLKTPSNSHLSRKPLKQQSSLQTKTEALQGLFFWAL